MARRGWKKPPRRKRKARASADQTPHPPASRFPGAYGFGLIALLWLGLGFVLLHATATDMALDSGLHAAGLVERISDATRTREETALVRFVAADGQAVKTNVFTGFFSDPPVPGQQVTLAYDDRNPKHARLIGADDLSVPAILFATMSIVLVATYLSRRRPRKVP
jgi:hypothetical protein